MIRLLLIGWAAMAAVAVPADLHLMRWALAGRLGPEVQSRTRETHARLGGTRVALVASAALDLLLPPVSLAMSAASYARMLFPKRRPRQAPATSPADDGAAPNPPAALLGAPGLVLQRPWAVVAVVAACAVAAGAGAGLRLLVPLPALAAAGAWAAVIAWRLAVPGSRPGRWPATPPQWAADAEAAEREMPAGTLDVERIHLARLASRAGRRGSYLLAWRCEAGARYRGLCRSALVRDEDGYLLAVIGEHALPSAMGLLGHEVAHLSGWRARVQRAAHLARLAGWLLAAWSAGWPRALAAGAVVQVVTMLAAWAVEAGCDVHAARELGTGALVAAVRADADVHPIMPAGELRLFRAIWYVTGLATHPPDWARCLVLRAFASGRAPGRATLTEPTRREKGSIMKHQRWGRRLAAATALAVAIVAATEGCGASPAPDPVVPGELTVRPPGRAGAAALTAAQVQDASQAPAMLAAGITGAGTTVAAIAPYADPGIAADLDAWSRGFGLPGAQVQVLRYDGAPDASGPPGSDAWEWAIEETQALEMAHLLAPEARLLDVAVPPQAGSILASGGRADPMYDQALAWLVATRKPTVVTYSSGIPEAWAQPVGYQPILRSRGGLEAAARVGVTVVASAGDFGPTERADSTSPGLYSRPVVAWPASDPLVTVVGGTRLARAGRGWAASVFASGGRAGGEGRSAIFARPAWQDQVAAIAGARRGVADVSMDASPCSPILTYITDGRASGWCRTFSGTSMAAPLLAGLVADAAQVAGHPLGVLGPALYQMHGPADGISDIATGTDTIPGIAGYPARPGYDLPTGIGAISRALRFTTALARLATQAARHQNPGGAHG